MATLETQQRKSGRTARIAALSLPLAVSLFATACTRAEVQKKRFAVTPDRIIAAIREHQLPTEGVQINLWVPMTTQASDSQLDVQEISRTGTNSARLKITCHQRGQCLPFFVSATWPAGVSFLQPVAQPASPASLSSQHADAVAADANSVPGTSPHNSSKSVPVVLSGSPATLLIEDQKMHIRLQVVCLQDGADGAHIRVATLDRKHSYTAEVVMPGLVKGSF